MILRVKLKLLSLAFKALPAYTPTFISVSPKAPISYSLFFSHLLCVLINMSHMVSLPGLCSGWALCLEYPLPLHFSKNFPFSPSPPTAHRTRLLATHSLDQNDSTRFCLLPGPRPPGDREPRCPTSSHPLTVRGMGELEGA